MKSVSKRKFLKKITTIGLALAGSNLPVWGINSLAKAAVKSSDILLKPNQDGLMLPRRFTSRIVAITGQKTKNSNHLWHGNPDGGAVFNSKNGGWIYVSNSETSKGGASALSFDSRSNILGSYSICEKTRRNCAGGKTPWGTWITCEEVEDGFAWECDPLGEKKQIMISNLGMFNHEAAAVHKQTSIIYLTEDAKDGGFFRFVPNKKIKQMGDLSKSKGVFQVMKIKDKKVVWNNVPNPLAKIERRAFNLMKRRENKNIRYTKFQRGEGAWCHNNKIYFATTLTNEIWEHDIKKQTCEVLYKGDGSLREPDNITVSNKGLIVAAEDSDNLELCVVSQKTGKSFPIVRIIGHEGSEVTGPAFNPSGNRLYFSSQRGRSGKGITYEVAGPFNSLI